MSALEKVLAASRPAESVQDEAVRRDEAAVLLAQAAHQNVAEAVRLALAGKPLPVDLLLAADQAMQGFARVLELPAPENWVEATAYDPHAVGLAADASKPYGDEDYADPGYQGDGKKRYPVTKGGKLSEERIRAAWSYIHQGDNAGQYSSEQRAKIEAKIKAAGSKAGVQFADTKSPKTLAASGGDSGLVLELARGSNPLVEALHAEEHGPFHGAHRHAHVHLGDNRHGPDMMGLAAGTMDQMMALRHEPMTGAHSHPHVHAGDGRHGPLEGLAEHGAHRW